MAYEIEEIRLSQQIFYYLLEHFELGNPRVDKLFPNWENETEHAEDR